MPPLQHDMFGQSSAQAELFADHPSQQSYLPNPTEVRQRLLAMLDQAKSAESKSPWDARKTRLYQVIFPQMSKWLPDDEANQLCFEFAREMERLKLAA